MVYHMINEAIKGRSPIKIVSDDTDVLVIIAHHLYTRTKNMPDTVQVYICRHAPKVVLSLMSMQLPKSMLKSCPIFWRCMHWRAVIQYLVLLALARRPGKATAFRKLECFTDILKLGDTSASMDDIIESCLEYVVTLYGQKQGNSLWLDTMRSRIFNRKIAGKRHTPPCLSSLPPTMAAFKSHCERARRAHYQAALWRSAGMPSPPSLDPQKLGWQKKGSALKPVYLSEQRPVAPEQILNIISCGCKTACKSASCTCTKFRLSSMHRFLQMWRRKRMWKPNEASGGRMKTTWVTILTLIKFQHFAELSEVDLRWSNTARSFWSFC